MFATAIIKKLCWLLTQIHEALRCFESRTQWQKLTRESNHFFLDAQYDKYLIRISMSYIIKIVVVTTNFKSDTRYNVSGQNEVSSISCNYSFIQNFQ